jgi:hypothetical protein
MRVLNRTRIVGKHHLQGARLPLVFVSNHVTIFDDGLVDTLIFSPRVFREYDFIPYHRLMEKIAELARAAANR